METNERAASVGLDCHKTFSRVTARSAEQRVLWRARWEHRDRPKLRTVLRQLPPGTPVVLEGTFGWAWMTGKLEAADLLSELPGERSRWRAIWSPPAAVRQQRERLRSLPGISYILAHTIAAEVGDFARFPDARHLASYSLLAPRADESGDEDESRPLGRHLGRAGRRTLKWAWLEAAHGAVRSRGVGRQLFDAHAEGGTRNRRPGYIHVAHRLCLVAFACQRDQKDYQPVPPPRPGTAPHRRRGAALAPYPHAAARQRAPKRPGVGQSNQPMVPAGV